MQSCTGTRRRRSRKQDRKKSETVVLRLDIKDTSIAKAGMPTVIIIKENSFPSIACANSASQGSGESARMRMLAWDLDVRLCDKYLVSIGQLNGLFTRTFSILKF